MNITKIATQAIFGAFAILFLKESAEKGIGKAFAETGTGIGITGQGVGSTLGAIGGGAGYALNQLGSGFSGLLKPVNTIFDLIFAPSAGQSVQPAQEQTVFQASQVKSAQSADFWANPLRLDKSSNALEVLPLFTGQAIAARMQEAQRATQAGQYSSPFGGFQNAEQQEIALQNALSESMLKYPQYFK